MVEILETQICRGTGGSYPEDKSVPCVTAASFTTAKTWKQPKHLLIDKHRRKMHHVQEVEYYPAIKEGNPAMGNNKEAEHMISSNKSGMEDVDITWMMVQGNSNCRECGTGQGC